MPRLVFGKKNTRQRKKRDKRVESGGNRQNMVKIGNAPPIP